MALRLFNVRKFNFSIWDQILLCHLTQSVLSVYFVLLMVAVKQRGILVKEGITVDKVMVPSNML